MKKILLASSTKPFLERNKNLLTRGEFLLFTTYSGAEAIQLQKEHHFDLILADLYLKDMGGDALCALVRGEESVRNVPFVLICYDKPDEHARVVQSGADAKIIRPVQPHQIIETVGSLLDMQIGRVKRAIFKVKVLSKKDEMQFYCSSLDISITGILLEAEHHLDIGGRIICRFTLPGSSPIEVEGDVVRSLKADAGLNQYGVQFVALPLGYRREIADYVASAAVEDTVRMCKLQPETNHHISVTFPGMNFRENAGV